MWTLQKLKGKEGAMKIEGNGEVIKKKLVVREERRSKRGHHNQSEDEEEECWSVDEMRNGARVVTTRSLHRRQWGWTEGGLDQPGSSWIKRFEDPIENTHWREVKHMQPCVVGSNQPSSSWINKSVGSNKPDISWVKYGHDGPPILSYLSISTGESWRERGAN